MPPPKLPPVNERKLVRAVILVIDIFEPRCVMARCGIIFAIRPGRGEVSGDINMSDARWMVGGLGINDESQFPIPSHGKQIIAVRAARECNRQEHRKSFAPNHPASLADVGSWASLIEAIMAEMGRKPPFDPFRLQWGGKEASSPLGYWPAIQLDCFMVG